MPEIAHPVRWLRCQDRVRVRVDPVPIAATVSGYNSAKRTDIFWLVKDLVVQRAENMSRTAGGPQASIPLPRTTAAIVTRRFHATCLSWPRPLRQQDRMLPPLRAHYRASHRGLPGRRQAPVGARARPAAWERHRRAATAANSNHPGGTRDCAGGRRRWSPGC